MAIAGPNPLRICTCLDHDEPLLGAAGDDHPEGCDCPVFQPVAKLTAPPAAVPVDSTVSFLFEPAEPTDTASHSVSAVPFEFASHAPSVPLYVALRTLRN
ncbi:MAG: hypothetical protein U0791_24615 [Gemmataceae bacterium]